MLGILLSLLRCSLDWHYAIAIWPRGFQTSKLHQDSWSKKYAVSTEHIPAMPPKMHAPSFSIQALWPTVRIVRYRKNL
eukprot:5440689-Amphidinium_carterae.1